MGEVTEERWNTREAAQAVCLVSADGRAQGVRVEDAGSGDAVILHDKYLIRAVAARMMELAAQLPEPPRILRRAAHVDEQLRGLDQ